MNAIELKERIDLYMDTARNGRFEFIAYNEAVRDAVRKFINNEFGPIEDKKGGASFQSIQQIRDNLYTLIKSATPTITTLTAKTTRYASFTINHIDYPTDYYEFIAMQTLIGGITMDVEPMEDNEKVTMLNDSFARPTNNDPRYLEDATGYKIYRSPTATLTTVTLDYIKTPALFSIGYENLLIDPGNNLTLGLDYIAIEQSVNNLVTYQPGQLFNAGSIQLVSGQVILASNTTACDLPPKTHEIIAKMAAEIMSGSVSDYQRAQFVDKETSESQ